MTECILLVLLAVGLLVLTLPEMKDLYLLIRYRVGCWSKGFRNDEDQVGLQQRLEKQVFEHIRKLLQVTFFLGTKKSVIAFFWLSGILAAVTMVTVYRWISPALTLVAMALSGGIPYFLLLCKMQGQRVASSQEGEVLVTELLNNYKIYYCNMGQAIEVTAMTMTDAPHCRQLLLNLSRGLNKAATGPEVESLLEVFRFSIGTSWANILTTNLFLACHSGIRVTDSLSDLARSMAEARKLEEYARRENNEARWILRYLVPACSILILVGGCRFFGMSLAEFRYYQFQTGPGITWFVLWLAAYLTAVSVHLFLTRRKFDL